MARKSKIDRLPEEIRERIASLRRENGCTIDEIMAKLDELDLGPDGMPSRSAMGRHIQRIDEEAERLARSHAAAEAIVGRLGEKPGKMTRLNALLMQDAIYQAMAAAETRGDIKSLKALSDVLDNVARAEKTDADREIKIRDDQDKRTREASARKIDEALADASKAGEKGLTRARVEQLRRNVLMGVA